VAKKGFFLLGGGWRTEFATKKEYIEKTNFSLAQLAPRTDTTRQTRKDIDPTRIIRKA
jgi:hypothetical protein